MGGIWNAILTKIGQKTTTADIYPKMINSYFDGKPSEIAHMIQSRAIKVTTETAFSATLIDNGIGPSGRALSTLSTSRKNTHQSRRSLCIWTSERNWGDSQWQRVPCVQVWALDSSLPAAQPFRDATDSKTSLTPFDAVCLILFASSPALLWPWGKASREEEWEGTWTTPPWSICQSSGVKLTGDASISSRPTYQINQKPAPAIKW